MAIAVSLGTVVATAPLAARTAGVTMGLGGTCRATITDSVA